MVSISSKNQIELCLNDLKIDDIKETRKSMFSHWTCCISTINGIERYLVYISKRRNMHMKLSLNLSGAENLKDIAKNIKE